MSFGGGSGGGGSIQESSDVLLSSPVTGQNLQYNGSNFKWTNQTPSKGAVGLGNADNTSDANKPVSAAVQTALDGKQPAGSYAAAVHTHAVSDITNLPSTLAAKVDTSALSSGWGVTPTLYWTGSAWPARTVPAGYSGAVVWDSAADQAATAPLASVAGDRWLRRVS